MAESKKEQKAAGKKAWRHRVKTAIAEGKKTLKVGKSTVKVKDAAHKLGLTARGKKKSRKSAGPSAASGYAKGMAAYMSTRKKGKGGGKKGGKKPGGKKSAAHRGGSRHKKSCPKSCSTHHRKSGGKGRGKGKGAKRTRTITVRLPGKTRTRQVTKTVRLKIKGNLAENPLSGMEMFAGGLTLLLGLGVADVADRMLATHPLTGPDANGNFSDVVPVDSSGKPTQSANGASVMEPMDAKRWIAGGVIVIVPFIAAHFVKNPTGRSALQLFGFGAAARVLGKGIKDLLVRFTATKGVTQRLYASEIAGYNQAALLASAQGNTPGPVFPNAPAPGLGHALTNKSEVGGRTDGSGDRPAHRPGTCSCGGTCSKCKAGLSAPVGAPPAPPPHVQAPAPQLPAPLPRAAAPAPAAAPAVRANPFRHGDAAKLQ